MSRVSDGWVIDDTELQVTVFSPVCSRCKNLRDIKKRKCVAFDFIPTEIWSGDHAHTQPYQGDNGIRFEPIDEAQDGQQ